MNLSQHYENIEIEYLNHWDTGMTIGWSCQGIGFGQLTFSEEDGFDTEGMSQAFVLAVLKKLALPHDKPYPTMGDLIQQQRG